MSAAASPINFEAAMQAMAAAGLPPSVAASLPGVLCPGADKLAFVAQAVLAHPSTSHWSLENFDRGSQGESIGPVFDQRVMTGILVLRPLATMLLLRCMWEAFMRYACSVQRNLASSCMQCTRIVCRLPERMMCVHVSFDDVGSTTRHMQLSPLQSSPSPAPAPHALGSESVVSDSVAHACKDLKAPATN